ncbi:TetR/AcrR family transcriptional regulator [Alloalcanivorax xenomutans]|uniref:TetR/AcrR family transcriptional regulator n=1 Tax=Alloalcanivorax xenomutans TaxID=1094342 RepID=A0A9Q3W3L1_9GAMM|nr:TetR/AcrR family transcriptional regulator [Alloalcanivorax xenomutans]MCE7507936.1 TetR/AcrR family transcriptional regulator [Alloalcanivorax xenomutans]WOD26877.1 TetR/AcrR family transcriptional regulator [Alloalcanivorax xenomutans]
MSPSRGRRPGRPENSTGPDQRSQLLDVAVQQFSEHGISGTPLSRIAREARVTPALLHYYFGNKDQLVDAVVRERVLALMAPALQSVTQPSPGDGASHLLDRFVATVLETVSAAPWLPPLWVREVLTEGGQLREMLMREVAPRVTGAITEAIERDQRRGLLNPDIEPRLVPISVIGLTIFALATRSLWSRFPGNQDIDTATLIRHVRALLSSGLSGG